MYILMFTNSHYDTPDYIFFNSYMEAKEYMLDNFYDCMYEEYGNESEWEHESEEYALLENGAFLHPTESDEWYDWWIFEPMVNS